jgi:two-component system NtrC family sensor kinase
MKKKLDPADLAQLNEQLRREIAEHKAAEDALRESEQKYRDLVERANDGIAIIQHTLIKYANPRLADIVGYSVEEATGIPFTDFVYPDEFTKVVDNYIRRMVGEPVSAMYETALRHKDGRRIEVELNAGVVTYKGGAADLVFVRDITKRKAIETHLAQAQKLESIGQLAAGIAHEINNPTQYVGDNTRFLKDAFKDIGVLLSKYGQMVQALKSGSSVTSLVEEVDALAQEADVAYLVEEIPRAIEQTLDGVERVSKIVRAMKEFSHPGSEEKIGVDINKAIESTITVARNEWKYVAEMQTDFDASLPLVPCLPGEFNQVILNIVINAAHAIAEVVEDGVGGKGEIHVGTRRREGGVEIRISDTGPGIPEENRPRVFDPFFTTKEVGKGTGQGLAIAHSVIVDKHGGTLGFETETGKGTTFVIFLPVDESNGESLRVRAGGEGLEVPRKS